MSSSPTVVLARQAACATAVRASTRSARIPSTSKAAHRAAIRRNSLSGNTLINATLSGTTTNAGTISGGTISGSTITGATITSPAISSPTISGTATFTGPISADAITGTTITAALFTSPVSTPAYLTAGNVAGGSGGIEIDTSQRVLMTGGAQPAVFANLASNQTSGSTVICGTIPSTGGINNPTGTPPYNTSTGVFTAPVTGTYAFAFNGTIANSTGGATSGYLAVVINSTQVTNQVVNLANTFTQTVSIAIPGGLAVSASQTITVQLVTGGAQTAFSSTFYLAAGASFSCRLIG